MNARRGRRGCVVAAALAALFLPGVARADAVTDWDAYTRDALAVTARQPPRPAPLHTAMVDAAMYDRVQRPEPRAGLSSARVGSQGSDTSQYEVERPGHVAEIERIDEQARVSDLPAAAAAHEPPKLLLRRPSLPRRLFL
jgi:hypothetical protein